MLRLTLRTLLAYLDDTLSPSEAKALGGKLAESEQAQEIVERIKSVIRRRRLTVPPATSRMDANTIAEYLDNEITPESAEELERICLSSDVHLAEVAACHQILSLVLGEPASAPEDAVKRMYALGKGLPTKGSPVKPTKRGAKAAPIKPAAGDLERDETLRMGLPSFFNKERANRLMFVFGGLLAGLLLMTAVWQLLKKPADDPAPVIDPVVVAKGEPKKGENTGLPEVISIPPAKVPVGGKTVDPELPPTPEPKVEPKPNPQPPIVKENPPPAGDLPPPTFSSTPDKKAEEAMAAVAYDPPSPKVAPFGKLIDPGKDQVAVVVQQVPTTLEWKRLSGKADLLTARPLVSLPGSKAPLVTMRGVRVTLWGNIPEHLPSPPVQESMVEVYDHETLDLDMTLRRGRVLLTNLTDAPVMIRVRFENTSEPGGPENHWLLTLTGKNAEAMIDRWCFLAPGEPFFRSKDDPERKGPISQVACMAVSGTVLIKTPTESTSLQPPPNPSLALWSSVSKKMATIPIPAPPVWLTAKAVTPPEILSVRAELNTSMTNKAVDVGVAAMSRSNDILTRRTAVRCLGAIDDLSGLLDALNDDKIDIRIAAVETLFHWIALSRDNDYKLHDLLKQRLKANEADLVMTLLHGFPEPALSRPETYENLINLLRHGQMPIRELAAWNLYRMVPGSQKIFYDAADPAKREQGIQQWQKLIPPGKLPPMPKKTASHEPRIRAPWALDPSISAIPEPRLAVAMARTLRWKE